MSAKQTSKIPFPVRKIQITIPQVRRTIKGTNLTNKDFPYDKARYKVLRPAVRNGYWVAQCLGQRIGVTVRKWVVILKTEEIEELIAKEKAEMYCTCSDSAERRSLRIG